MIELIIPPQQERKIDYFLREFRGFEWSGPAWYKILTNEDGYPKQIELVSFEILDLGEKSTTEWKPEALGAFLVDAAKNNPKKLEKLNDCVVGNLHSHNEMGSFFSSTDDKTLKELATRENFYVSLVVSTKTGQEYVAKMSYLDQYGKAHADKLKIVTQYNVVSRWEAIIKKLRAEKAKKPTWQNKYTRYAPPKKTLPASVGNAKGGNVKEGTEVKGQLSIVPGTKLLDDDDIVYGSEGSFHTQPTPSDKVVHVMNQYKKGKLSKFAAENELIDIGTPMALTRIQQL